MSDLINLDEKRIIRDLLQGDYEITFHAQDRMFEREITPDDVTSCAKTVISIQQHDGKFRVKGYDVAGEYLVIVCVWNGNTLIITLF